jgi:hypothetical protein
VSSPERSCPPSGGWTTPPSEPPDIHGSLADQTVTISGDFHLDDRYSIEAREIAGQLDDKPIRATVEALDGGFSDTGTVAINGTFGATTFDLLASVSCGHAAVVCGTVDGIPVGVDGRTQSRQWTDAIHGAYSGPPGVLTFIARAVLWFM